MKQLEQKFKTLIVVWQTLSMFIIYRFILYNILYIFFHFFLNVIVILLLICFKDTKKWTKSLNLKYSLQVEEKIREGNMPVY